MRFDFRCLKKEMFSVLAGDVPVKVERVEEVGPVSVVGSGTADLRPNVVHS